MPPDAGAVAVIVVPDRLNVSGTYRWFMSIAWVEPEGRIRTTDTRSAASGLVKVKFEPQAAVPGEPEIVGRAPLNRYGGE